MRMLIVGIGALGGTIAARAIRTGLPVRLAARNTDSVEALRRSGLRVFGIGGEVRADAIDVAAVEDYYGKGDQFNLILLATKAQDALEVAPNVVGLLASEGVVLPIQNGGVARALADRLGEDKILGGFSNLGATMVEPGVYEQKNGGHLLIGELAGGVSERVERVARALGRAIEVKVSSKPDWCHLVETAGQLLGYHPRCAMFANHASVQGNGGRQEGLPTDVRGSVIRSTCDRHSAGASGRGPDSARMAQQSCRRGTL